jgi:ketosteroid isomerase-like protein
MGKTEDIILHNYEAFRRGDIDSVLEGWHEDGLLIPFGRRRSYEGHGQLRQYLEKDIYEAPEFDFRVYTVLEQGDFALIFGRYSLREEGRVVDKGVFGISRAEGQKLRSWEAFDHVGEAFTEFKRRLSER